VHFLLLMSSSVSFLPPMFVEYMGQMAMIVCVVVSGWRHVCTKQDPYSGVTTNNCRPHHAQ
jgi:hypothetical protein